MRKVFKGNYFEQKIENSVILITDVSLCVSFLWKPLKWRTSKNIHSDIFMDMILLFYYYFLCHSYDILLTFIVNSYRLF